MGSILAVLVGAVEEVVSRRHGYESYNAARVPTGYFFLEIAACLRRILHNSLSRNHNHFRRGKSMSE